MTVARVFAVAVGYALNVYLARSLGPESFGLFATVLTVLTWLELAVAEGLPPWVIRIVDREETGPLVPPAYVWGQLALSVVLMAGLFLAAPLLASAFGQPAAALFFRVAAIDIPIFALYNLFIGVLIGTRQYGLQTLSTSGYSLVKLLATVVFVGAGLSVLGAVLGGVVASVGGLVLTIGAAMLFLRGRPLVGEVQLADVEDSGLAEATKGGVLAGSVIPAVLLAAQQLSLSADLWLVKAMLPPDRAGFYRAASLVAQVPLTLSAGIVWSLYAEYSDAQRRGDTARQSRYLTQIARLVVAAAGLCIAVVVPTAGALLNTIFSRAYEGGSMVLVVLITGISLGGLAIAFAPIAILEGHGWTVLPVAVGLVGTEIAASVFLIGRLGLVGAAIPVAVAFTLGSVAVGLAFRHRFKLTLGQLAQLIVPAVVVGGVGIFVHPAPGLQLVVYYVLAVAVFGGLLFATGGLTLRDIAEFREEMR